MSPNRIISAGDYKHRKLFQKNGDRFLNISEFYFDTIQGEGANIGVPAAFLRLQNCTLNCSYCDTTEVWRFGSPYTFNELFYLMERTDILYQLRYGQHLVFTGGSPLLQQDKIVMFLDDFVSRYEFTPITEIENECVIMPSKEIIQYINIWNNSPKLVESGVPAKARYKVDVLKALSELKDSWFKFVLSDENEWNEIYEFFINPQLISRKQIILMPEGDTKDKIEANREMVLEIAIREGVRYSTREHLILWDKKVGF